jgi:signal transduction histidine kinase
MLLTGLALRERKDPEKTSARVGEIAASARQVIKSLDETVWAINPRNDTLPDLVNYVGQFAVEFMRTADLPCQVELPDHPPRRRVSAEARHNLFLAVKEALNNIVRHAGRCEVRVQIKPDPDALRIVISDNGVGFGGKAGGPEADGLRNMQQRLAELGGRCEVDSHPGAGTRITFVYTWPPAGAEELAAMTDDSTKHDSDQLK